METSEDVKPEPPDIHIRWPSEDMGCKFSETNERHKIGELSEFYFENDHLALAEDIEAPKSDYRALLRTLAVLEAQKVQAVRDVEALLEARARARADPLALVEKLQRGEDLGLPVAQVVACVPSIDWAKYKGAPSTEGPGGKRMVKVKEGSGGSRGEKTGEGEYLVRGRMFRSHKPVTFNQPWTKEEQVRLEDLLQRFPSEEVEMERWKKIAGEMGNRSAVQIQSRVQKYFLKLQRAGLPIPGRLPPQRNRNRFFRAGGRRQVRGAGVLTGRTTFLASVVPEVLMEEEGGEEGWGKRAEEEEEDRSTDDEDEVELGPEVRDTPEHRELRWLLRVSKGVGGRSDEHCSGTS